MAAICSFDLVLTPTGRRAQVIVVDVDGYANIVYLDSGERGAVHVRLLKRLQLGREAPAPARIDAEGAVR